MKHMAIVRMTHEALAKAIGLPEDHRILGVRVEPVPWEQDGLDIKIEGPLCPAVHEGWTIPIVTMNRDGHGVRFDF